MKIKTKSARETQKFGRELAKKLRSGGVVALYGELGAGKTTLVQGIAQELGVKGRIISPTFILVRRYPISDTKYLWHIDLYRLTDIREIKALGIEEIVADKNNIVLIEWPEKIENILPKKRYNIRLQQIGESEREIRHEALH